MMRAGFEGGQNPLYMRTGKLRGTFMKKSMPVGPFRTSNEIVNLSDLAERFARRGRGHAGDAGRSGPPEEHEGARQGARSR